MNKNLTEIVFILDRSGSMAGLESDTIGGFNGFIENQKKMDGETIVSVVLFDDKYEVIWNGISANEINLTDKEYFVRGYTALLDAIGRTILEVGYRLAEADEDKKPGKVIFVIITDGLENASCEFSYEKVKELILHQQEKYGWEFVFLGANIDVAKETANMGICQDNAFEFEASETGIAKMYDRVCEVVSNIRTVK